MDYMLTHATLNPTNHNAFRSLLKLTCGILQTDYTVVYKIFLTWRIWEVLHSCNWGRQIETQLFILNDFDHSMTVLDFEVLCQLSVLILSFP